MQKMDKRTYDLEERLVDFTCRMIDVIEALPNTRAGIYLAGQLTRSCHSPALNYGEAQAAESISDFIHKLSVVLKELKECRIGLKIIINKHLIKPVNKLRNIYIEAEELIAIVAKSIITASKTKQSRSRDQ